MDDPKFRITNYLNQDFDDAYVVSGGSTVDVRRAVAFLDGFADRYSQGIATLTNDDIADLLVKHYGFAHCHRAEGAAEIDVSMETGLYFVKGVAQTEFEQLLTDPQLLLTGVTDDIEKIITS